MARVPFPWQCYGSSYGAWGGEVGEEGLVIAAVSVDKSDQLVGIGLRCLVVLGDLRQIAPVLVED